MFDFGVSIDAMRNTGTKLVCIIK